MEIFGKFKEFLHHHYIYELQKSKDIVNHVALVALIYQAPFPNAHLVLQIPTLGNQIHIF